MVCLLLDIALDVKKNACKILKGIGFPLRERKEMVCNMSLLKLKEIIQKQSLKIAPKNKPFILKSGKESNYYLDLRKVTTNARGLTLISIEIEKMIQYEDIYPDAIGGPETGAIPIIGGLISRLNPVCEAGFWVKKEKKKHGMGNLVEGSLRENMKVVLVEDVTTSGASLMRACDIVSEIGCEICQTITVVKRRLIGCFLSNDC